MDSLGEVWLLDGKLDLQTFRRKTFRSIDINKNPDDVVRVFLLCVNI